MEIRFPFLGMAAVLALGLTACTEAVDAGPESIAYVGYGAQQTVSGSLHALDVDGDLYLIDVGSYMGEEGENYPWPAALAPDDIEAVFITHAHADHIGRLPLLLHEGYHGPIFMTQVTYDIAQATLPGNVVLSDFGQERFYYSRRNQDRDRIPVFLEGYDFGRFSVAERNREHFLARRPELDEQGFYIARSQREKLEEELLERLSDQVRILHPGDIKQVGPLEVEFIHTAHMPGSVMVSFGVADLELLFSGDVGSNSSPLLSPNPRLERSIDYLWLEGTYGTPRQTDYPRERREFRGHLGELLRAGHRIVIPAFVVDRTQQVLSEIATGIREGAIPADTPVKVYSRTANDITDLYRRYAANQDVLEGYFAPDMTRDSLSIPGYQEFGADWDSEDSLELKHGEIGIMSSGMMEHAFALRALRDYGDDPRTAFYLVGYQAPGTPGYQLREGTDTIVVDGDTINVRAKTFSTFGFSGHADPNEMLKIFEESRIGQLLLVHMDASNVESLTSFYRDALGIPVKAPKPGERFELLAD